MKTPEKNQSVWIVVPAYNEEGSIESVLSDLKTAGYSDILVVDDGSRDNTGKIAKDSGAEVLKLIINRGQGAALKTGISYIRETYGPDIIVTFDADGQHRATDIAKLIRPISEGAADIVLGSRFFSRKSNTPLLRKIILKAGILFTNFVSDVKLTDTHNGLRALGRKAVDSIEIAHRGMEHASDIIDEITKKDLIYREIPVEILYSDYSKMKGQKNFGFIKMGIKVLIKKITE